MLNRANHPLEKEDNLELSDPDFSASLPCLEDTAKVLYHQAGVFVSMEQLADSPIVKNMIALSVQNKDSDNPDEAENNGKWEIDENDPNDLSWL